MTFSYPKAPLPSNNAFEQTMSRRGPRLSPRLQQERHREWSGQRYRAMPPKVRDILKQLNDDGWTLVTTRGSHRQFKHPSKSGRVTVHGRPSDDIAPGTLNSILKQAELKK